MYLPTLVGLSDRGFSLPMPSLSNLSYDLKDRKAVARRNTLLMAMVILLSSLGGGRDVIMRRPRPKSMLARIICGAHMPRHALTFWPGERKLQNRANDPAKDASLAPRYGTRLRTTRKKSAGTQESHNAATLQREKLPPSRC